MPELPHPDADAAAHSAQVAAHAQAEIVEAGGFLPFARFMEIALYAPGLGYYAAGATKLGAAGDFITAPEMTPLFGRALAVQVDAILAATRAREVLELGAGSGALAGDLLRGLAARDALPSRYAILEPSPDLRERQRRTLETRVPEHAARVTWLETLPAHIEGAVMANEVLDAVPAHVVVRRSGVWHERGVTVDPGASHDPPRFGIAWAERPARPALAALAEARMPDLEGYTNEINPAAEALVETLARRVQRGAVLLVDYGFPAHEYYHPQRAAGTLMCHYRHRAHDDPLQWPGLTDITAHVDFSAMAAAGVKGGLEVAGFAGQAPFLLGCGILDALAEVGPPDSLDYIKAAGPVQRLLSPAEMGEFFKVLALARDGDIAWPGFAMGNRRHRL